MILVAVVAVVEEDTIRILDKKKNINGIQYGWCAMILLTSPPSYQSVMDTAIIPQAPPF